jgi:hypothetical protein
VAGTGPEAELRLIGGVAEPERDATGALAAVQVTIRGDEDD